MTQHLRFGVAINLWNLSRQYERQWDKDPSARAHPMYTIEREQVVRCTLDIELPSMMSPQIIPAGATDKIGAAVKKAMEYHLNRAFHELSMELNQVWNEINPEEPTP